jgi:hypothetical protein
VKPKIARLRWMKSLPKSASPDCPEKDIFRFSSPLIS